MYRSEKAANVMVAKNQADHGSDRTSLPEFTMSLLVEPKGTSPFLPLLVASTAGSSIGFVAALPVVVVVANVSVELTPLPEFWNAASVKKTSATEGAGTLIVHVPAVGSQLTVSTVRLPDRRPSD